MAALVAAYTFDWNRDIPSYASLATMGRALLWNLVHQLTGQLQGGTVPGAWTCVGSSDGSTAGMDGTNRWWNGGTFNPALLVHATGTTAHSWLVLRSPAALAPQMDLLFDFNNAASANERAPFARASFTPFTGGSITAAPTSDASWLLGSDTSLSSGWLVAAGAAAAHRTHLSLAADGAFFWSATKNGASIRLGLIVGKVLNAAPLDECPVVTWVCSHSDGMQLTCNNAFPSSGTSPGSVQSAYFATFLEQDSGGAAAGNSSAPWAGRTATNGSNIRMRPVLPKLRYTITTDTTVAYGGGLDATRQQYPEWPLELYIILGTGYGWKGTVRDMWTAFGPAEFTVDPSGTDPIKRIVWGNFWVPANAAMVA